MLGDMYQQNAVLCKSSPANLPPKVRIDHDVPGPFQSEYKRFKSEAWKRKKWMSKQCQIVFNEMVLRYRDFGEGKGYRILESITPSPAMYARDVKGNQAEGGSIPSENIMVEQTEHAERTLWVSGPRFENVEQLRGGAEE